MRETQRGIKAPVMTEETETNKPEKSQQENQQSIKNLIITKPKETIRVKTPEPENQLSVKNATEGNEPQATEDDN